MSTFLTSADIEDGKVEVDPVTKVKTTYKVVDGGYQVITETPMDNGGIKTEKRTFWDPKPVSEEDLLKEQENRKKVNARMNKEIRIDERTTMLTRAIDGGWEEVYTTTNDDGTKSVKTKTFFDSVPADQLQNLHQKMDKQAKKKPLTKKSSVEDSSDNRKLVQKTNVQDNKRNYKEDTTVEESRRVTQNIEYTENNRTVRKNSLQEQSVKSISQNSHANTTDGKTKKKKSKSNIPPPPPDFIQNDTTTISSRRVPGGVEYTYSTRLDSGTTLTTSKTVYEEEEIEMTEEEIREYKKTLRDAEKHKNVTTTKKLKSQSGTKKVIPSENPGDVTTVETIQIEGGTEYHYTTVQADGRVKKAVKTVYDPVPSSNPDDDEEEIIEDYEEEIIEPGEKNYKTIESIQRLPKKFEEEVTITTEKTEKKKVKKSMMYSS